MDTADRLVIDDRVPTSQGHSAGVAVLISGGLDSAILLAETLRQGHVVHPLYVRTGLLWETVELTHLGGFLEAMRCAALQPLQVLDLPVGDLYGTHWSITGQAVPDEHSADEAVFLPGRNVLLLSKTMLWCHLHGISTVVLGLLGSNPFQDATPSFFGTFQNAVNQAVGGHVHVRRPYTGLSKMEVMQRGRGLPLERTFSCIRPMAGRHCGRCNKCAERRRAFAAAGMADTTEYATSARPSGSPASERGLGGEDKSAETSCTR
jgi:7-cyano-7-deazaguanine synthase